MNYDFYDVKDVAAMLGIGKNKSYALFKTKGFPAVKIGNAYKVSSILFDRWVADTIAHGGVFEIKPEVKR